MIARASRTTQNQRGSALPITMLLIFMVMILYTLSIERTLAERNHVLSYYYSNVTLDLAENGVAVAASRLKQGSKGSIGPVKVGTFRGLDGFFEVKVDRAQGRIIFSSKGYLSDDSGKVRYATKLRLKCHLDDKGRLEVDDYQELLGI